jgi:hypothetical protein
MRVKVMRFDRQSKASEYGMLPLNWKEEIAKFVARMEADEDMQPSPLEDIDDDAFRRVRCVCLTIKVYAVGWSLDYPIATPRDWGCIRVYPALCFC